MEPDHGIRYINRVTQKECTERVYGYFFLTLLYGGGLLSRLVSIFLLPLFAKCSLLSRLYGAWQKSWISRFKIPKFITKFQVDTSEFLEPPQAFASFNDFFIRKLKPTCRPIVHGGDVAILPADGRFLVYENIALSDGFLVKGEKFCLEELVQSSALAAKYANGSMVIGRLAPVDYHRFHFPARCVPQGACEVRGPLYSVNPIALKGNIDILARNRRMITPLQTKSFGTVLSIEVGATYVGTIHQTFVPGEPYAKGDEKGYFSFGGSCLILLFEPGSILLDQDLTLASHRKMEVLGRMGQSLGRALSPL